MPWWRMRKSTGNNGARADIDADHAYERGRADGKSRSFLTAFTDEPHYAPPFVLEIHARFSAELQEIGQRRRTALAVIHKDDVEADNAHKWSAADILKKNEAIKGLRQEQFAIEQTTHAELPSGADSTNGASGLDPEAARKLRRKLPLKRKEQDAYKQLQEARERAVHANRTLVSTPARWHDCHDHHTAEAHKARALAIELIRRYQAGVLATHPRRSKISGTWSPPLPELTVGWLAEQPDARFNEAEKKKQQDFHLSILRSHLYDLDPSEIDQPGVAGPAREEETHDE